jgi:hypothetical protein
LRISEKAREKIFVHLNKAREENIFESRKSARKNICASEKSARKNNQNGGQKKIRRKTNEKIGRFRQVKQI